MVDFCYECGNQGLPGGCPRCGTNSDKLVVQTKNKEKFIKSASFKQIPSKYIGVTWDREILYNNHPELHKNMAFTDYCSRLETMHNIFRNGMIPNVSAFISAPSQMSKSILAYSCMQHSLNKGLNVAPFLDTIELKRLMILAGENPGWKLYGYIDYDKYIMSDVLFVSVTKTDLHTSDYTIISELLARRSRFDLPTFILSKFSLKEIAKDSMDNNYKLLLDINGSENPFKYPTIIEI